MGPFERIYGYNPEPTERKFWMVYGSKQGRPTYEHETEGEANAEAIRLAALNPGVNFYVLVAVRRMLTETNPVRIHNI